MNDGNFEVHERGTARELKLLRELASVMQEQQQHMQAMNCYPRQVRLKFADVMLFYKEQQLAGNI